MSALHALARRVAALWGRVVAFVQVREDATSLAVCRVVVCLTVLCHFGRNLLSGAGAFMWARVDQGGVGRGDMWLAWIGGATPFNVQLVAGLCCAAAFFACIGLFTRPALVVTWITFRAISMLNDEAKGAYDALLINELFLLMLSGCGRALSVDARAFPRADDTVPRWPRMLILLQIGLLYGGSAVMKASSGWVPGGDASALWYILHQPMWTRFDVDTVPGWMFPITQVATTISWCFEATGPLFALGTFLNERRPRRWLTRACVAWLAVGVAMHIGIEVTLEVGAFTGASLGLYAAAIRPERVRAFMERCIRRCSR